MAVALASVIAYSLLDLSERDFDLTQTQSRAVQARLMARGLEDFALINLKRDFDADPNLDHLGERWASQLPPLPFDRGVIRALAVDLDGRFNINSIVRPDGSVDVAMRNALSRLVQGQGLDAQVVAAIKDWIDEDTIAELGGAEDIDYLRMDPPFRAPNRPLRDISELSGVRGIDARALSKLKPLLAALPTNSAQGALQTVNLNTAPFPVFKAFLPELEASKLEQLRTRGKPWRDMNTLEQDLAEAGLTLSGEYANRVGFSSQYFMARAEVEIDGAFYAFTSLMERRPGVLRVIWRRRG
jgi:general secretion pathway protein K